MLVRVVDIRYLRYTPPYKTVKFAEESVYRAEVVVIRSVVLDAATDKVANRCRNGAGVVSERLRVGILEVGEDPDDGGVVVLAPLPVY